MNYTIAKRREERGGAGRVFINREKSGKMPIKNENAHCINSKIINGQSVFYIFKTEWQE